MDLKITLNINIDYYFVNNSIYPNDNTLHHIGWPITLTIIHFGLNNHHRRSVENTQKKLLVVLSRGLSIKEEMEKKYGRPYLVKSSSEINLLAN